jgi:Family of unknown function (DUF6452)
MKHFIEKYYIYVVFAIITCIHFSCNKESACLQYSNISAKIDFKHENDTLLVTDTILTQPILITDSFYTTQKFTKSLQFLMKSTSDNMQFVIARDSADAVFDTILLLYTRAPHFVSKECGYNYFYTLQNATTTNNAIKKIKIIQPLINDDINAKHLQIYY